MRSLPIIALLAISTTAIAQDQPRRLKTLRIEAAPPTTMYRIEPNGTVLIDWPNVERAAASATPIDSDFAKALLAVRDRTWKPAR